MPKGVPGWERQAGKFTSREAYDTAQALLKSKRQAEARERKNAKLRESRKEARERRAALVVTGGARKEAWGEVSTSRMREKTAYAWHGQYKITGSPEVMKAILKEANSEAKLKGLNFADPSHELIVTPYLGKFTPGRAEAMVPDIAAGQLERYKAMGAEVEYMGAFYRERK